MADDGTKSLIRSCLISAKEGLTLSGLQNDYSTLVGGVIPYRAGGFSSLEEYLRAMPDVVRFQNTGGSLLLHCVVNASTANIASMVARQKSNKKKPIRRPRGVAPRGGVYGGPGFHAPRFDYRHQRVRNVRPAAAAAPWGAPRFGQQFRAPASARMPLVRAPFRPAAAPPLLPSPQPARSASWSQMPPRRLPPRPSAPCQQPVTVQPPAPVSRPPSAAPPSQVSPPVAAAPPRQPPARPPSAGSSILDEFEAVRLEMRLPEPKVSTVPSKGGTFFAKLTGDGMDRSASAAGSIMSLSSSCAIPGDGRHLASVGDLRGVECAQLGRVLPELCDRHGPHGDRVCGVEHCRFLHLCRLYVDGFCPRCDDVCPLGHRLDSEHNYRILHFHCMHQLRHVDILWMLKLWLQQMSPLADSDYWTALEVCAEYCSAGGCSNPNCCRLHICDKYLEGACTGNGRIGPCGLIHSPTHTDNLACLVRLRFAEMTDAQILQMLTKSHHSQYTTPASAVSSDDSTVDWVDQVTVEESASDDAVNFDSCHSEIAEDTATITLDALDICDNHLPSSPCNKTNCSQLHICRYFVADICPYDSVCYGKHHLSSHCKSVLESHGLRCTLKELLEGLYFGYLTRHPIKPGERRRLLQLCLNPVCKGGDHCYRMHLCPQFVMGVCGKSPCSKCHDVTTNVNYNVLVAYQLESLSSDEVVALLEKNSGRVVQRKLLLNAGAGTGAVVSRPPSSCSSTGVSRIVLPSSVCRSSLAGARCFRSHCTKVHVCLAFSLSICRRKPCPLSHKDTIKLDGRTIQLQQGCKALMVCGPYNTDSQVCQLSCKRFHLCHRFLSRSCTGLCSRDHNINSEYNKVVKSTIGVTAIPNVVLVELLRARLGSPCEISSSSVVLNNPFAVFDMDDVSSKKTSCFGPSICTSLSSLTCGESLYEWNECSDEQREEVYPISSSEPHRSHQHGASTSYRGSKMYGALRSDLGMEGAGDRCHAAGDSDDGAKGADDRCKETGGSDDGAECAVSLLDVEMEHHGSAESVQSTSVSVGAAPHGSAGSVRSTSISVDAALVETQLLGTPKTFSSLFTSK